MQTARLLSDINTAYLYSYLANEEPQSLEIYMSKYRDGKVISTEKVSELSVSSENGVSEGMIAIIPDYENFTVKLIMECQGANASTSVPILENVEEREYYARTATQIEEVTGIQYDTEQRFLALIYDDDEMSVPPIDNIDDEAVVEQNDYMYCFSFRFSREQ